MSLKLCYSSSFCIICLTSLTTQIERPTAKSNSDSDSAAKYIIPLFLIIYHHFHFSSFFIHCKVRTQCSSKSELVQPTNRKEKHFNAIFFLFQSQRNNIQSQYQHCGHNNQIIGELSLSNETNSQAIRTSSLSTILVP
jgi:hypothetical protein